MPAISLHGPITHRLRSLGVLVHTSITTVWRRITGRPLVAGWPLTLEIGTVFHRRQFMHAFHLADSDMAQARTYFDSLRMRVEPRAGVHHDPAGPGAPAGSWITPASVRRPQVMLYLHGGGFAFDPALARVFADALAARLGVRTFRLDYRLTPEHPHPAQLDDALAAYRWLLATGHAGHDILLAGDSAGGHLALSLLALLRDAGLPQPAIALALCPWTEVGRCGDSQFGHDPYDMLQGWQTLRFGEWMGSTDVPGTPARAPMALDFHDAAPIYLQAGGREVLADMIDAFARRARAQGAQVRLDTWPDMPHEFQFYGRALPQSREALQALEAAVDWACAPAGTAPPAPARVTRHDTWSPPDHTPTRGAPGR